MVFLNTATPAPARFSTKRVVYAIFIGSAILVLLGIGLVTYARGYENRVLPGVRVGDTSIGGFSREEVTEWLRSATTHLVNEGAVIEFDTIDGTKKFTLYPIKANEDTSQELVRFDIPREVDRLMAYGKSSNELLTAWHVLRGKWYSTAVTLATVEVDAHGIEEAIADEVHTYEPEPQKARLHITSIAPLAYRVTSSSPGLAFEKTPVSTALRSAWQRMQVPTIVLKTASVSPSLVEADISESVRERLVRLFASGPLRVSYIDPVSSEKKSWTISEKKMADWIDVQKASDGAIVLGLDETMLLSWLEDTVGAEVTVAAQNARFQIDSNGKVTEFQGSHAGTTLEQTETLQAIQKAVQDRSLAVESPSEDVLALVTEVLPEVSTAEANGLGITDILGVGISKFTGSPANRIKNIKNGMSKINGLLIKPGEEFSTVKSTQPYTLEGGYVPELVIQGNKVEPAIGGGLCQISTTLFRMAMNSGLDITERRNHALLVAYYNDLVNNMPGTDATIFEPSPDFKFVNDTPNYVLIQADIDEKKSELRFTLWGTSDGRKGSYTHPEVKRWIPYGATRTTETTTLAPGVKKCQHAYQGAEAAFTYTRTLANGEKIDRVFESYYRPLPEICLVGAAATSTPVAPSIAEAVVPIVAVPATQVVPE